MAFYDKMLAAGVKPQPKVKRTVGPGLKKPAVVSIKPVGKARPLTGGPMGRATDAQLAKQYAKSRGLSKAAGAVAAKKQATGPITKRSKKDMGVF